MTRRQKPKFLVMSVRSDENGGESWHIMDGRRVISTGFSAGQHVAAVRAFRKYHVDKEQKRSKPPCNEASRRRTLRRTARAKR
ncbi:hypothetical protein N2603_43230 [Bradyrhizobium huanghuaihaiense]|uniref:hypothetical protein n=1 Tax=Bradyrhizobium huanghuaihaiense TaxID=990078 RepID=UPI0021AA0B1A|nr:hypothetical protein [Bradyrhizobium sp. CB3035]UWU76602.1 hypothetical protein N2603_43230 [Bradyrhizobium sp. CB3035]